MSKVPSEPVRIVVDTNVWISFLLGGIAAKQLGEILESKAVLVLFSPALAAELQDVMLRPKIKARLKSQDIQKVMTLVRHSTEWVTPDNASTASRDPKDNFVLDLAVTGGAAAIISGDRDLRDLKTYQGIAIKSIAEFLTTLEKVEK